MILYSSEVYLSILGEYNRALWPGQVLALFLGLLALGLVLRKMPWADRIIAALLAAAWIWVGTVYFLTHMATIDYAAPVLGWAFILQGLLLAWRGLLAGKLAFRFGGTIPNWIGLGLALFALAAHPLLALATGLSWPALPLLGVAPGPTALFTLGLLVMARGWERVVLAVLPLLWCAAGGFIAWELMIPADYALPLAGLLGLGGLIRARSRPG